MFDMYMHVTFVSFNNCSLYLGDEFSRTSIKYRREWKRYAEGHKWTNFMLPRSPT